MQKFGSKTKSNTHTQEIASPHFFPRHPAHLRLFLPVSLTSVLNPSLSPSPNQSPQKGFTDTRAVQSLAVRTVPHVLFGHPWAEGGGGTNPHFLTPSSPPWVPCQAPPWVPCQAPFPATDRPRVREGGGSGRHVLERQYTVGGGGVPPPGPPSPPPLDPPPPPSPPSNV